MSCKRLRKGSGDEEGCEDWTRIQGSGSSASPGSGRNSEGGLMRKRMSAGVIVCVMALIALTGFSCSKEKPVSEKKPSGHEIMVEQHLKNIEELKTVIVARVNGTAITKYDLFTRANKLKQKYVQGGKQMTPEMQQNMQKEALDLLVFRELAIQEAIKRNMNVPKQNIDAMLQQYKAKIGTEKEYEAHLKRTNLTEASVRKLIEREQLFRMINAMEIFEKVKETGAGREQAVEKRKRAWAQELKQNANIEILLTEVGKKPVEEAKNPGQ